MIYSKISEIAKQEKKAPDHLIQLEVSPSETVNIYPRSITKHRNHYFFIARSGIEKHLYIISSGTDRSLMDTFSGIYGNTEPDTLMRCGLTHENVLKIQELFEFTRPVLIGTHNSFGFGDRLGLAGPGHVRAIEGINIKPVFAQQSIRELERTERSPEDVIDAAVWTVFQEGYRDGFGADADHLKTTNDIDVMVRAGFTLFTIDPGAFVINDAHALSADELYKKAQELAWNELDDRLEDLLKRYENINFAIADDFSLQPGKEEILQGMVKYGNVIIHTMRMYRYLKETYPNHPCEIELSVDETDSPTSPFEHFLVSNELKRLEVPLVSLAPRFIGDFEKGIDYKGDISLFSQEYRKHIQIANFLGPYKLSLHSGSDKFSVYEAISRCREGLFHIKTAGTSYLVALQTTALKYPQLFREILDFSRDHYEAEKKTYHVSGIIENVPLAEQCTDEQLMDMFDNDDARQVLHVNFGKVLTVRDDNNRYHFRERILNCLKENEQTHYELLKRHFLKHIEAFVT